jgi:signal transduction histidine kinase
LEYSRATNSKIHKPVTVDMNAVASEVTSDLDLEINKCGGMVIVENLPNVRANVFQMKQLLNNLIGNGLKYHGEEPPVIRVTARQEGRMAVFAVSDNGVGIDPQNKEKIFDLFQRTETTDKPGTGIGLAICKKIIENQGGRIWVESKPGKGSTFNFTLPIRTSRQPN